MKLLSYFVKWLFIKPNMQAHGAEGVGHALTGC